MKTVAGMKLTDAAKALQISFRALIQELRARNILDENNLPYRNQNTGDFVVEQRQHQLRGYHITRHYYITLVTGQGMTLLAEIVRDIRNGNKKAA